MKLLKGKKRCGVSSFLQIDNEKYCYRDGGPLPLEAGYHPHVSTRFKNYEEAGATPVNRLPELYSRREECCGCTACVFVCPKAAISMEPDEEGFLYPVVDAVLCIGCGKCMSACAFKGAVERD